MLGNETLQGSAPKPAALFDMRAEDQVMDHFGPMRMSQPAANGGGKALLATFNQFAGQKPACHFSKQTFPLSAPKAHAGGDAHRQLHQNEVKKKTKRLPAPNPCRQG